MSMKIKSSTSLGSVAEDLLYVEFNRYIFKKLTKQEIFWIIDHCNSKLNEYYATRKF